MASDEEARSTDRPPAPEEDSHPDIASAIQRAKTNASPGRYGPPAATAKIGKFDLAQALALTTADGDVPTSSKPPREDDAPFVPGEVEVVGEEEVTSGVPGLDSVPPASEPKAKSESPKPKSKAKSSALTSTLASEDTKPVPEKRDGNLGLIILGVLVGVVVIAYVYVTTR